MQDAVTLILAWKGIVVLSVFAGLFIAERLAPAARPDPQAPGGWPRLARNGVLFAINAALSPLVVVPLTAFAAGHAWVSRPAWWSGWSGFALDLVLLDAFIYAWHRANHVVPLLWRFHEVHHLDRFLDTTTATRFHFGEVLLSALVRAGFIVATGMPLVSVLVFEALLLCAALFQHSNLKLPARLERALSLVIVTPSIHWVHHHRRRADTDSNYSTVLSLWDRLFGTSAPTARTPTMAIGTEGREERDLVGLILAPVSARRGAPRARESRTSA